MTDPLLGRVLRGRYRIERKLGQGGMGAVYAAVHLELARPVAVKTLLDVVDARDVDRLRTEALAAASLAHPHIVSVTDFAAPKGDEPAFLVMELLAGHSLAHVLARDGALASETAIHIALQILDALGAAHEARILHRDIKPANVIVLDGADMTRPWIKVVDFGIAKIMDDGSRHTTTGTLLGTPAYMAPEQLLAERATERTDIYSVGVCLFEMLAGSRPFTGSGGELASQVLRGEPPALPVEPRLAEIVKRAMRRDPHQRFASARELAEALRALARAPAAPAPPSNTKPWALFTGTMLATVAVAGVVVFFMTKRATAPPPRVPVAMAPADADVALVAIDADVPVASAANDPDADAEPDAAKPAAARGVLSMCVDASGFPLCAKLHWYCQCKTQDFAVFDSPEEHQGKYTYDFIGGKDPTDSTCSGWTHAIGKDGYRAIPTTSHLKCAVACSADERVASRRIAVPGTPCAGYQNNEKAVDGKWKAVR